MSRVVRKPAFCICENKGADQLRSYREADQRLCFRYMDSTIPLQNFKLLAIFYGCTARFVWGQVKNPENRFSHNKAHIMGTGRNFLGEVTQMITKYLHDIICYLSILYYQGVILIPGNISTGTYNREFQCFQFCCSLTSKLQ